MVVGEETIPMKNFLRFTVALLILALLASGAWAQSVASAELSGTVTDPKGAVVPGATVTVRDAAKNFERSATSGPSGEYHLLQLPPGSYTLSASAEGFAQYTDKTLVLTVGQTAELPITLGISTSEAVEVNAQTALVETQRTSSTNTVGQERIDNLPINGRNYINFTLTDSQAARDVAPSIGAAPTSGINFNGQRARSNLVNLDGMDQIDNSVNGVRSTVSQDAVQEFQIIENGYAPEYGRASGGVVNIVSRSGSNDWHGSAYGYLRNRYIQATNPFSNVDQPAYTRVQPGFTLGGPIRKDKDFFFLSYEGTFRQETGFSTIGANNFGLLPVPIPQLGGSTLLLTPDQAAFFGNPAVQAAAANPAVAQALQSYLFLAGASSAEALNGLQPVAFGGRPGFATTCTPNTPQCLPVPASYVPLTSLVGNYPVVEHTNTYSLRLDDKLNAAHQLMFRLNVTPSNVTGIQVNAQNQNFGQNAFSRTSVQNYHDAAGTAQHTWIIGNDKVNEFRFQYARRGLRYDFSRGPGGGNVAVNIPGFAFFGREPFSFVDRVEQRYQFGDNFSWSVGNHNLKFGADINHLPLTADFTVNFGGLYNFGELSAAQINSGFGAIPGLSFPAFSPVQAYGLGIPQVFVQGVGNPHDELSNSPLGFFAQDSWRIRPNLTLNYGLRYDVELTEEFKALNALSQAAQNALGITQGIPRDTNNVAPRIGLAWDPGKDGKTVVRASYGIFYDHPLLALGFDSDVADGTQAPQLVFTGGAPNPACDPFGGNLNATNLFQGIFNTSCFPGGNAGFGYLPDQQRFNASQPGSVFVNQNYLTAGLPLIVQPFGFPVAKNFEYAYSEQANLSLERQLGKDFSISVAYNFNGGHHLNRPINVNAVRSDLLIGNWENALLAGDPSATSGGPLGVTGCGIAPNGKPFIPAAVASFFRPSGLNPSLFPGLALLGPAGVACQGLIQTVVAADGLGLGVPVPFSDMVANFSNGSSVYHGATVNLKKRFSNHYEFLGSYTYSHTIDDSTDLQSLLEPADNFRPDLERASSAFDQRHRFVLSGVYQSGKVGNGEGLWNKVSSNWTVAPIIELSSGRPFNVLVGSDANFDFSSNTDRPNAVSAAQAGAPVPSGCLPAAPSKFSPTGFFQPACFIDGTVDGVFTGSLDGNVGRDSATRPWTAFTDFRVARDFKLGERVNLQGIVDMFNLINRFNVADVNPLYTQAGTPTAAFDPRQFQFALKLSF